MLAAPPRCCEGTASTNPCLLTTAPDRVVDSVSATAFDVLRFGNITSLRREHLTPTQARKVQISCPGKRLPPLSACCSCHRAGVRAAWSPTRRWPEHDLIDLLALLPIPSPPRHAMAAVDDVEYLHLKSTRLGRPIKVYITHSATEADKGYYARFALIPRPGWRFQTRRCLRERRGMANTVVLCLELLRSTIVALRPYSVARLALKKATPTRHPAILRSELRTPIQV